MPIFKIKGPRLDASLQIQGFGQRVEISKVGLRIKGNPKETYRNRLQGCMDLSGPLNPSLHSDGTTPSVGLGDSPGHLGPRKHSTVLPADQSPLSQKGCSLGQKHLNDFKLTF